MKRHTVFLGARVEPALAARVKRVAAATGRDTSKLVRAAVQAYLEWNEPPSETARKERKCAT